mmetsp:Transcript_731/g.2080  ORF Transcript_731/g.2080 Transcript_731/m.2080 type:complete len:504 (-) Transcript_731:2537-4048(-)
MGRRGGREARAWWVVLVLAAAMPTLRPCTAQSKPQGPLKFPTKFPPWPPEWNLLRSTIAQPCNYSGWFSPELAAHFGVISVDWANHQNSYRTRPLPGMPGGPVYPDDEDLVTQAIMIKRASANRTKVFVYRQGQGLAAHFGRQAHAVLSDPAYDGFWLKTVNHTTLPGDINRTDGRRVGGVFDFRNTSLRQWFVDEYVGGPQCIGHPAIDGWFADDVYGLGSPGSPDATPVVKETGMAPREVAAWNAGQQQAVIAAQTLAVSKRKAFNWQNFQPMCEPGHDEPCPNGWTGMAAPNRASCLDGAPDGAHGKGFAGLRKLCSTTGGRLARDIPFLYLLWHDRNAEAGHFPGQGSCTEVADCALDTCKAEGGGVDCAPIVDIRQRIAAFLLARGPYAWMGYNWMGCAGSDHRRKYMPFPSGPYPCPQNASLRCAGYTDGARWQPPAEWDPEGAMTLDYGAVVDSTCVEVSPGVFQRRFDNITVRLDCNTWTADFAAAAVSPRPTAA